MADKDFFWPDPLPEPDFYMLPKVIKERIMPRLSGTEFKVFFALACAAYEWQTGMAERSLRDLVAETGAGRTSVKEALDELIRVGLVAKVAHASHEHGTEKNTYYVRVSNHPRFIAKGAVPDSGTPMPKSGMAPPESGTPAAAQRQGGGAQGTAHHYVRRNSKEEEKKGASPHGADHLAVSTWDAIRAKLQGGMTPDNYRHWFEQTRALTLDEETLTVVTPSDFHQRWLDQRLRAVIDRAAARVVPGMRVAFVAVGEVEGDARRSG